MRSLNILEFSVPHPPFLPSPQCLSCEISLMWILLHWYGCGFQSLVHFPIGNPYVQLVPWWAPQPLRRIILSMYICIFVFATRFRSKCHFSYSANLGKGLMFTASTLASIGERRQLGVRKNKSSERPSASKDFEILAFWTSGGNAAVTPYRFMNARFAINIMPFVGGTGWWGEHKLFFLACNFIC